MTYVECPHCGGKALNVATRCPQCGGDFPARPIRRGTSIEPRVRLAPLALAAAIVVGVIVAGVALSRTRPREAGAPVQRRPTAEMVEASSVPVMKTARARGADTARGEDTARSTPVPTTAPATPTLSEAAVIRRYARTWTHVRAAPTRESASELVLDPGQVVEVDSLRRGWYRVLIDGRPIGYVHRSNLDLEPPAR